jgi:hypothetical protein
MLTIDRFAKGKIGIFGTWRFASGVRRLIVIRGRSCGYSRMGFTQGRKGIG